VFKGAIIGSDTTYDDDPGSGNALNLLGFAGPVTLDLN